MTVFHRNNFYRWNLISWNNAHGGWDPYHSCKERVVRGFTTPHYPTATPKPPSTTTPSTPFPRWHSSCPVPPCHCQLRKIKHKLKYYLIQLVFFIQTKVLSNKFHYIYCGLRTDSIAMYSTLLRLIYSKQILMFLIIIEMLYYVFCFSLVVIKVSKQNCQRYSWPKHNYYELIIVLVLSNYIYKKHSSIGYKCLGHLNLIA